MSVLLHVNYVKFCLYHMKVMLNISESHESYYVNSWFSFMLILHFLQVGYSHAWTISTTPFNIF